MSPTVIALSLHYAYGSLVRRPTHATWLTRYLRMHP
jgi:hypothetical protein